MSRTESRDIRLGIVAMLVGTVLVLGFLVAIARYPALFLRGNEYEAVFQSVAGLNQGDEVRYGGLLVGAVAGLEVDPEDPTRILVSFRVKESTPVRADTRAVITQLGLLGDPFLNLVPGSLTAPTLPPGSRLTSEETMSFQEAVSRLAHFFDRADTLLGGIERVARTDPWSRIERTLTRVEELVETTTSATDRVFTNVEGASERLNELLVRTESVMAGLDTSIRVAGPGIVETQEAALVTVRELHDLIVELQTALDAGGGLEELVRNMSAASENIARLSDRLERDPSALLKRRETAHKPAGPAVRD